MTDHLRFDPNFHDNLITILNQKNVKTHQYLKYLIGYVIKNDKIVGCCFNALYRGHTPNEDIYMTITTVDAMPDVETTANVSKYKLLFPGKKRFQINLSPKHIHRIWPLSNLSIVIFQYTHEFCAYLQAEGLHFPQLIMSTVTNDPSSDEVRVLFPLSLDEKESGHNYLIGNICRDTGDNSSKARKFILHSKANLIGFPVLPSYDQGCGYIYGITRESNENCGHFLHLFALFEEQSAEGKKTAVHSAQSSLKSPAEETMENADSNQTNEDPKTAALIKQFRASSKADWLLIDQHHKEGSFGKSYKVPILEQSGQRFIAVKQLDGPVNFEEFKGQVEVLKSNYRKLGIWHQFWDPNLVRILGVYLDPSDVRAYVCMDYLEDNVQSMLKKYKLFSPKECFNYAMQAIFGLQYLHSMGLAHGNLKPSNLLIDPDKNQIKLSDYFIKVHIKPVAGKLGASLKRVFSFVSPESIKGEEENTQAMDIWAVGAIGINMFFGEQLNSSNAKGWNYLKSIDDIKDYRLTVKMSPLEREIGESNFNPELRDFFQKTLIKSEARFSAEKLINHFKTKFTSYELRYSNEKIPSTVHPAPQNISAVDSNKPFALDNAPSRAAIITREKLLPGPVFPTQQSVSQVDQSHSAACANIGVPGSAAEKTQITSQSSTTLAVKAKNQPGLADWAEKTTFEELIQQMNADSTSASDSREMKRQHSSHTFPKPVSYSPYNQDLQDERTIICNTKDQARFTSERTGINFCNEEVVIEDSRTSAITRTTTTEAVVVPKAELKKSEQITTNNPYSMNMTDKNSPPQDPCTSANNTAKAIAGAETKCKLPECVKMSIETILLSHGLLLREIREALKEVMLSESTTKEKPNVKIVEKYLNVLKKEISNCVRANHFAFDSCLQTQTVTTPVVELLSSPTTLSASGSSESDKFEIASSSIAQGKPVQLPPATLPSDNSSDTNAQKACLTSKFAQIRLNPQPLEGVNGFHARFNRLQFLLDLNTLLVPIKTEIEFLLSDQKHYEYFSKYIKILSQLDVPMYSWLQYVDSQLDKETIENFEKVDEYEKLKKVLEEIPQQFWNQVL